MKVKELLSRIQFLLDTKYIAEDDYLIICGTEDSCGHAITGIATSILAPRLLLKDKVREYQFGIGFATDRIELSLVKEKE